MHDPLTRGAITIGATPGESPPFVAISVDPLVVGRSGGAGLRLHDPTVSRRHATLVASGGVLSVEDHDSRFGTFVNGSRVRSAGLRPGDRVRFGRVIAYRVRPGGLALDGASGGMELDASGLTISAPGGDGAMGILDRLRGLVGPQGRDDSTRAWARVLVRDVGFRVRPDTFVGILGPSGAGKSTLLGVLAGYLAPDCGRVVFDGRHDVRVEPDSYRAALGHVPQDDVVFRALTVRENLRYAADLRLGAGATRVEVEEAVERTLDRVELAEHAARPVGVLSGGQRKRLSVAIELLRRPRLLLLDEPTSGLDPAGEARLMEGLRSLARRGTTVACTTHLMDNLHLLDEVIVLGIRDGEGRLAYAGPPDGLADRFGRRHLADLYEILASGRFEPGAAQHDPSAVGVESPTTLDGRGGPIEPRRDVGIASPATRDRSGRPDLSLAPDPDVGQLLIVARRAIRLTGRDRGLALAMLAQPVGLGLLVALSQFDASRPLPILFFAAVIALWLGLNNSARDLVRERRHYVRDRLAGLGPVAYLGAKALVHAGFGLGQVLILLTTLRLCGGLTLGPGAARSLEAGSLPGLSAVLMLSYLGGVGLGLLLSTLAATEEAAVAALPLLIMPQLLLSVVATGFQNESYSKPRPFRPLVATLAGDGGRLTRPAAVVDLLSMACLSRPATLVAERPALAGFGRWAWVADLCHLMILLLATWAATFFAFLHAERRWLRRIGL